MGEFFSFWWASISESLGASWDKIGEVDLAMTVFGGLFLFALKKSPWSKWKFYPDHPVWEEAWRLFALFIALFAVTVLVYAPFQQFEKEHLERVAAENDSSNFQKELKESQGDATKERDRADQLSDALNMSKDSVQGGEKVKELESELSREKVASAEVVLKQQQEIDSLKSAANPISAPIASASADISIRYALVGKPPAGNSLNLAGTQVAFGAGTNALLVLGNGGMTATATTGDGTGTLTTTCSAVQGQASPYVGKPMVNLQDAQYVQLDTGAIPPNSSILGGTARWVINGLVPLNFEIPAQTMGGTHIMIRNLSDGFKPLSSAPSKSASPP